MIPVIQVDNSIHHDNSIRPHELPELPEMVHEKIRALRDEGKLFDFTIKVGERELKSHKVLLAACSDYFKAMLSSDSRECRDNLVELEDVEPETMESILDFCYTSRIDINVNTVQSTLMVASRLQFLSIQEMCVNYLRELIDIFNCLCILRISSTCNLTDLYQRTLEFCLDNFCKITDTPEFLDLEPSYLKILVSNDYLNVDKEVEVVNSVMRWLNADKEGRLKHLDDILSQARFPLIEPLDLIRLSENETVKSLDKSIKYISKAKDYLLLRMYHKDPKCQAVLMSDMMGERCKPRHTIKRRQRIFAIGGWTQRSKSIATVEEYNPHSDSWREVEPMSKPRCGVGVTVLGQYIYAVGGHDGQDYLKTVERFDTKTGIWSQDVSDMHVERTSLGVVALNGYIYAIGGQSRSCEALETVERYDPSTNEWTFCKSMLQKRLGAGVTVLDNSIYVIGGACEKSLNSVECYNPVEDKWYLKASMRVSRKHFGCTTFKGSIYVAGGRYEINELDSTEKYDPNTNSWTNIPKMSVKRSAVGLVGLDDYIYAVGGVSGETQHKLVEAFDFTKVSWGHRQPLKHERLGGGLVAMTLLIGTPLDKADATESPPYSIICNPYANLSECNIIH